MREVTTNARHIDDVSLELHPAATVITRLDVDGEQLNADIKYTEAVRSGEASGKPLAPSLLL